MKKALHFFSLFSSTATLVCCAIPALLVVLGFGATLASFLTYFPQLIWLSENKFLVFVVSGSLILLSHIAQFFTKPLECPIDEKGVACKETRGSSKIILWIATLIWLTGFSFAYILPLLN
ncbi:MAG: hypothetical protein KDD37_09470 [Bdellovibrionales bacterium]|nr:hypothetical protein [Bdellovibrionales bacterium]